MSRGAQLAYRPLAIEGQIASESNLFLRARRLVTILVGFTISHPRGRVHQDAF